MILSESFAWTIFQASTLIFTIFELDIEAKLDQGKIVFSVASCVDRLLLLLITTIVLQQILILSTAFKQILLFLSHGDHLRLIHSGTVLSFYLLSRVETCTGYDFISILPNMAQTD